MGGLCDLRLTDYLAVLIGAVGGNYRLNLGLSFKLKERLVFYSDILPRLSE